MDNQLRVQRVRLLMRTVIEDGPPLLDLTLDVFTPGPVLLLLQPWEKLLQCLLRVPHQMRIHGVPDTDEAAVDVDLDTLALALWWQPFRIGETRADHEQRVRPHHHGVARSEE